jgi:hypothetical protein
VAPLLCAIHNCDPPLVDAINKYCAWLHRSPTDIFPYTKAALNVDWPNSAYKSGYWDDAIAHRAYLVEDNGNPVLETLFPQGCVGPNQCSLQIKHRLAESLSEATLSYRYAATDGTMIALQCRPLRCLLRLQAGRQNRPNGKLLMKL